MGALRDRASRYWPMIVEIMKCDDNDLAQLLFKNMDEEKGDMVFWIEVMAKFDKIMDRVIEKYGLEDEDTRLQLMASSDAQVIIAIMKFVRVLIMKSENWHVYSSSGRVAKFFKTPSIDVKLEALELSVVLIERSMVFSSSKRFTISKASKMEILRIAKCFPPPLPVGFSQKISQSNTHTQDDSRLIGGYYSLVDTLNPKMKYPSKWKSLSFPYFSSSVVKEVPSPEDATEPEASDLKIDKKKKKKQKMVLKEGVSTFVMSDDVVRKYTYDQILDKGSASIPKEHWNDFSLAALIAKSFNARTHEAMKLREKLIRMKCFAIAFLFCVCPSNFIITRFIEAQHVSDLNFVVDLILPEYTNLVSKEVYYAATRSMQCLAVHCSLNKTWTGDMFRYLCGNVSHGMMYQNLRYIQKQVASNDPSYDEVANCHFIHMVDCLIDSSWSNRFPVVSLLNDFMSFLTIETKYKKTCSAAAMALYAYLRTANEPLEDFVNNGGFQVLIQAIRREVGAAVEIQQQDLKLSIDHGAYISDLLLLVAHILDVDFGDRLRNLFDSPILLCFNVILESPQFFGRNVVGNTVDSIRSTINNLPSAYSILKEARVIKTLLDNYDDLFFPSKALFASLADVIGPLCLNKDGLKEVLGSTIIHSNFKVFLNVDYSKELDSSSSLALGRTFDELSRYYPELKPLIIKEVKNLLADAVPFLRENLLGVKFYTSLEGSFYTGQDDDDNIKVEGNEIVNSWETSRFFLLDNIFNFTGGLFYYQQWNEDVLNAIPFEYICDLLTIPNSPYDIIDSFDSHRLEEILSYFDSIKRGYGLELLIQKLKTHLQGTQIQSFFKDESTTTSHFARFENDPEQGTILLQQLNIVACLLHVLILCYISIFKERILQLATLVDAELIRNLGLLLRRCTVEETVIRSTLPASVAALTIPYADYGNDMPPMLIHSQEPFEEPPKRDGNTAKYKNTLQMRELFRQTTYKTAILFNVLPKICIFKKQEFFTPEIRKSVVQMILSISEAFSGFFDLKFSNISQESSYTLVLVNLVSHCLSQKAPKDLRNTALVIGLLQTGYFDKICQLAVSLWSSLLETPPDEVEKTKELKYISVAENSTIKNAIYQIFTTFAHIVRDELMPNLPLTSLYFPRGYTNANHLVFSVLIQTRVRAMRLLQMTVGSESQLYATEGKGINSSNIPSQVIEQCLSIYQAILAAKVESKEDIEPFVPFDVNNIGQEFDILIENGVPREHALTMTNRSKDLHDIVEKNSRNIWEYSLDGISDTLIDRATELDKQPLTMFDDSEAYMDLYATISSTIWKNLFILTENYPRCVESIMEILLTLSNDPSEVVFEHLKKMLNEERSARIAPVALLFSWCVNKCCRNQKMLATAVEFVANEFENNASHINDEYFAYFLFILETSLTMSNVPQVEESKHKFQYKEISYSIPEDLKESIFCSLLKFESISEKKTAYGLGRVLILYARDQLFASRIVKSSILNDLIRVSLAYTSDANQTFDPYRKIVIILLRRCYETVDIVKNYMTPEILHLFSGSLRSKRELESCLRETSALVLREPTVYVDTFTKYTVLEGYDGASELTQNRLIVSKVPQKKETKDDQNEDVDMMDANMVDDGSTEDNGETTGQRIGTTGIVHTLINELMKAMKQDWMSQPEEASTKKEMKKKTKEDNKNDIKADVFKNGHFAYACFILQVLVELLSSYKQAKFEFVTFSKRQAHDDQIRPRPTALNFMIHQLVSLHPNENENSIKASRMNTLSTLAKLVLVSLLSTPILDEKNSPDPKKEDIDMAFIRRYFTDVSMKILNETMQTTAVADLKYSKLQRVLELYGAPFSTKFTPLISPLRNKKATNFDLFYIARCMIDKQVPDQIAKIVANFDLNYAEISLVIKASSKVLNSLGSVRSHNQELFEQENHGERDEDEIVPISDDREDVPDLFRNSTLGMYDIDESDEEDLSGIEEIPEELWSEGESIDLDDNEMNDAEIEDFEAEDSDIDVDIAMRGDSDLSAGESEESDQDSEAEEYDSSDSESDGIDIIEEVTFESDSDAEAESDISDEAEFFGFDDVSEASEYDDEYSEWVDGMRNNDEVSDDEEDNGDEEEDDTQRLATIIRGNGSHDTNIGTNEDEDEVDFERLVISGNRHGSNPLTALLEIFENDAGNSSWTSFVGGLLSQPLLSDSMSFGSHSGSRLDSERALDGFLSLANLGNDPEVNSVIKFSSTVERWADAMRLFYDNRTSYYLRVTPAIVNRIQDESAEIYKRKREHAEKVRQEKLEQQIKKEHEANLRREQEAKEREAQQLMQTERDPIYVLIGDREVDISGTDIDPEFFEALPEDMREEVFTQHIRERRATATSTNTEVREIDPDFLDALPEQIREEILQQESMARRFSFDHIRTNDEEEDDVDEDEEVDNDITEIEDLTNRDENASNNDGRKLKVFQTPFVDATGVFSILRLLFYPQPHPFRSYIHDTLLFMCFSKHTRNEVIGLMTAIMHDLLTNQNSIEKLYQCVVTKAKSDRTSGSLELPSGATSKNVGVQFVEAMLHLLQSSYYVRYYMLTEHEIPFLVKKGDPKNKIKELMVKKNRYPINYIILILANPLATEDQFLVYLLAHVLQNATKPLSSIKKSEEDRSDKTPNLTPVIADHYYAYIVRILTGNEFHSVTFRRTISTMQNMSSLPQSQKIFTVFLSDEATNFGKLIIEELSEAIAQITSSPEHNLDSKLLAKFSSQSSNQTKLLRILTAMDYMYEHRDKDSSNESSNEESSDNKILTKLYQDLALGSLWDALSSCLLLCEEHQDLRNEFATLLSPLIEALLVVCKHSKIKDMQIRDLASFEVKKIDYTKEPIERLFFSFTDEHKKILNQMVRTNPNLMNGPFGMLIRNPRVLEFDNKKSYFDRCLHQDVDTDNTLSVSVRRDLVFLDSYRALFFKSKDEFRNSTLQIEFKGESGVDAGGVTREWYQVLSRQMFNPDYALFIPVASDATTFHPNRTSYVNPEHLSFFKFIGKIIGKAIFDNCYLDCHFSRAVYKRILGISVSLKDMETLDLEYYKSLMWMLENDITDILTEDFSVETDDYGEHKIIDLIPDGRNIAVTDENKQEYIKKVVEYRLQTSVREQMDNFLQGFHEIIPKDLVSIFDEQELELLISGLPDIDVDDWQSNTLYVNYSPSSTQIQWFWRAVKSFDNEERAKLLQFATGTSKVPLDGFKNLSGANGNCKFQIHRDYGLIDRLPSSHTCFNQVNLPAYESYETLRQALLLSITEGHEGFGLA